MVHILKQGHCLIVGLEERVEVTAVLTIMANSKMFMQDRGEA